MSAWKYVVNFCLPPPLVLVFVLLLPLPKVVRKGVVLFINSLLEFTVLGGMKLIHFMTAVTACVFLGTIGTTLRLAHLKFDSAMTPAQEINIRAKRWREDRNFWIAFQAFFLWCVLWRLYVVIYQKLDLEERIQRLELALQDKTGNSTSKAVSSKTSTAAPSAPPQPSAPPKSAPVKKNE